jgi:hypothetical protein
MSDSRLTVEDVWKQDLLRWRDIEVLVGSLKPNIVEKVPFPKPAGSYGGVGAMWKRQDITDWLKAKLVGAGIVVPQGPFGLITVDRAAKDAIVLAEDILEHVPHVRLAPNTQARVLERDLAAYINNEPPQLEIKAAAAAVATDGRLVALEGQVQYLTARLRELTDLVLSRKSPS